MQDKYVGDTGDFGKYFLLKNLCKENLILGINWCYVPDEKNMDGKHTSYLDNELHPLGDIDMDLFQTLKDLVKSGKRNI